MTTPDDEYNGWPNRETWALSLCLENDEPLYLATMDIAREASAEYASSCALWKIPRNADARARHVGERIRRWFDTELAEWMNPAKYRQLRDEVGSVWRVDDLALGWSWLEAIDVEAAPAPDPSRYVTRSPRIPELHLEPFDTSNHRKVKP